MKTLKSMSYWAKAHRIKAIMLLVILQALLFTSYFFGGVFLFAKGIVFGNELECLGLIIVLLACCCHPFKKIERGFFAYTYKRAKFYQGLMIVGTLCLMMNAGNQLARSSMMVTPGFDYELKPVVLGSKMSSKAAKKSLKKQMKQQRKKMKKQFRSLVKKMRKNDRLTGSDYMGILLLGTLFTFLLGAVVLLTSCNLSCNGYVAASYLVLVGGITLWVWGLVGIVRLFKRGKKKTKANRG